MKNQEVMDFPSSIYEFLIDYSFKDSDEVYTNGILLIPTFRVKQAIEHYFEQTRWIPVSERLLEEATNGDMIKAMFPDVDVKEKNNGYEVYFGVGTAIQFFNYQWWNAPYKAESEE
jgi:hypothetical protein